MKIVSVTASWKHYRPNCTLFESISTPNDIESLVEVEPLTTFQVKDGDFVYDIPFSWEQVDFFLEKNLLTPDQAQEALNLCPPTDVTQCRSVLYEG